jgi:hypothetical protein
MAQRNNLCKPTLLARVRLPRQRSASGGSSCLSKPTRVAASLAVVARSGLVVRMDREVSINTRPTSGIASIADPPRTVEAVRTRCSTHIATVAGAVVVGAGAERLVWVARIILPACTSNNAGRRARWPITFAEQPVQRSREALFCRPNAFDEIERASPNACFCRSNSSRSNALRAVLAKVQNAKARPQGTTFSILAVRMSSFAVGFNSSARDYHFLIQSAKK